MLSMSNLLIFTFTCSYVLSVRVVSSLFSSFFSSPAFVFLPFSPYSSLIPICIILLSLPFSLLTLLSRLSLPFPFFSFCLTSLTLSCRPCYPLTLSSVSLYSYPSSLISPVFRSPVMLSSLPSYPSCLISAHPALRPSFHPFPRLSVKLLCWLLIIDSVA